ncbi:MAG: hypothetical protein KAS30_01140, partial [Candidatus Diapherotrites archaeon]|nr:hypothetical protein [Candidatus Diapherotrites archaeon]
WVTGSFDSTTIPACADQTNCSTTNLPLSVTLDIDTAPGTYTADIVINGTKTKEPETATVRSKVSIAVQVLERFAIQNNQTTIAFTTTPGTGDSHTCEGVLKPKTGGIACDSALSCGDPAFDDSCNPWGPEDASSFTVQNLGSVVTLNCKLEKQQTGTSPGEISWITLEDTGFETSTFTVSPNSTKQIDVKAQVPQIPKGAYTASITTRCWGSNDLKARSKTINVTMSTPLEWGITPPLTGDDWKLSSFNYNYPDMNEGDPLYIPFTAQSINEATGVMVSILDSTSGPSAKTWLSNDRSVLILPKGGSDMIVVTGNAPIGSSGNYSAILQFRTTLTNEIKTRTMNFLVGASLELLGTDITGIATEGITTLLTDEFGIINGTTGTFTTVNYSVLGSSGEGTMPVQPTWFTFSEGTSGWTGGTIEGGSTGLVNVSVLPPSETTPGTYTGQVTVTTERDVTVNSVTSTITQSKTIPVTVTVEDTLSLDKTSVIKSVDEGTLGTEVITVTNNSTVSNVNITGTTVSGTWQANGEWVTVTPGTPLEVGADGNQAFTININVPTPTTAGEYAGEYTGTVTFVSNKGESKTVNLIVRVNTSVVIDIC